MQSIGDDTLDKAVEGMAAKAAIAKYLMVLFGSLMVVLVIGSFFMTALHAAEVLRRGL